MKSVLISIQAEHNANIESGRKTEELRTRVPKCELPIKFLTYESGKNGRHKVTNEWICREIREYPNADRYPLSLVDRACVPFSYICDYTKDGEKPLFGLVITELVIYDKPKDLSQVLYRKQAEKCVNGCEHNGMCQYCKEIRPPQSWCYVEETE